MAEVTSARIPPNMTTGCDLSFEWRAEAQGPGSEDVYAVSVHSSRIYFRRLDSDAIFTTAILMRDQGNATNTLVPPVIADVVQLSVQDADAQKWPKKSPLSLTFVSIATARASM